MRLNNDEVFNLFRSSAVDKNGFTPLHRCCQEKPPKMPKKKKEGEAGTGTKLDNVEHSLMR
jgi:hypothetical protein